MNKFVKIVPSDKNGYLFGMRVGIVRKKQILSMLSLQFQDVKGPKI